MKKPVKVCKGKVPAKCPGLACKIWGKCFLLEAL